MSSGAGQALPGPFPAQNNELYSRALKLMRLTRRTGYDILLYVNNGQLAQWQSKRLLIARFRVRLPGCPLFTIAGSPTSISYLQDDLAGGVARPFEFLSLARLLERKHLSDMRLDLSCVQQVG